MSCLFAVVFEEYGEYVKVHSDKETPHSAELGIMSAGCGAGKWNYSRKNVIFLELVFRPEI